MMGRSLFKLAGSFRSIRWLRRHKRLYLEQAAHWLDSSLVFAMYRSAIASPLWCSEALVNSYIRYCIYKEAYEEIDAFLLEFSLTGRGFELTATLRLFDVLRSADDYPRLVTFCSNLERYGQTVEENVQNSIWFGNLRLKSSSEAGERDASESPFDVQSRIQSHIERGEIEEASSKLCESLYSVYGDKPSIAARRRNAQRLSKLNHSAILSFLQHSPQISTDDDCFPKCIPAPMFAENIPFRDYLSQQIRMSWRIRSAIKYANRNGNDLAELEKTVIDSDFAYPELLDLFLRLSLKVGDYQRLSRGLEAVTFRRAFVQLDSVFAIYLTLLRDGETDLLAKLEAMLPFINEEARGKCTEFYQKSSVRPHVGSLDLSEVTSPASLVRVIAGQISEGKFQAARDALYRLVFSNRTGYSLPVTIHSIARLAASADELDVVLDGYVRHHLSSSLNFSSWPLMFGFEAYLAAVDDADASRNLLDRLSLSDVPEGYAKKLYRWMSMHTRSKDNVAFFENWYERAPGSKIVRQTLLSVLLDANEPGRVVTLLSDEHEQKRTELLILARAHISLGNKEQARRVVWSLDDEYFQSYSAWLFVAKVFSDNVEGLRRIWAEKRSLLPSDGLRSKVELHLVAYDDELTISWREIFEALHDTADLAFAVSALNSAYLRDELGHFEHLLDWISRSLPDPHLSSIESELKVVLNLLYKLGRRDLAGDLLNQVELPAYGHYFEMIKNFSLGNPVEALDQRAKEIQRQVQNALKRDKGLGAGIRIMCPERHIAGELYNSFYFRSELRRLGPFSVLCDERLRSIFTRSFPEITFIGKTPPRNIRVQRELFSGVPAELCEYFDAKTYEKYKDEQYFYPEAANCLDGEIAGRQRREGWFVPDSRLVEAHRERFRSHFGAPLIGFAPASSVSSVTRARSFVDLERWSPIFNKRSGLFVNLSPSFTDDELEMLAKKEGIQVYQPDFDLLNDFENLIALLSVLDYAILPGNSLMDFASSVGLPAFVFSPSSMLRNWEHPSTGRYIFSDRVQFVYLDKKDASDEDRLVKRMVSFLDTHISTEQASAS